MGSIKNIAIFASGSGTNAQRLAEYFQNSGAAKVAMIFCNNPEAYVIERAKKLEVPVVIFNKADFYSSDKIIDVLKAECIDIIVLAGFLWLIPSNIIKNFPNRIVNIHPALLPKYGGKGMYGMNVHKAVIASGDEESGISIHYVNEDYDEGNIIFQVKCTIDKDESPESLAAKIHQLEYEYFPQIVESLI